MDIEKHIKDKSSLYFGSSGPSPEIITSTIVAGALILGATETLIKRDENWFYIFADRDWLYKGKFPEENEGTIWERPWPFPEAGQNTPRFEIMACVFSSTTYTVSHESFEAVKGNVSEEQMKKANELLGNWERLIAFEYNNG